MRIGDQSLFLFEKGNLLSRGAARERRGMGKKTAEMVTISRLFVAYRRQGIAPKNAIRLIATSLNRTLKYVESVVQNDSQSG